MMKIKATILLTLLLSAGLFAQDTYIRSAVIPVPAIENGGYGNVVSGVDFDGDGMQEIYAINQNWNDSGNELIPRIYKYENNAGSWDSVWSATLNIPLQNTWPAIAAADLDNDGKMEIVWGPVNYTSAENPNPSRFVVFEAVGDGSDNLGVDDGAGGWLPNAEWNGGIVDDETNMRPIKFIINDVDNDGTQEILFPDRGGYYYLGVVSVDNIPDAGDGSETWTMEFSGKEVMPESFVRSGVIGSPDGGFGNVASGMDYDADGLMDLYAVNDNWNDGPNGELIPTLYKYELVSGAWVLRWSTVIPGIDFQNTWPVMVTGDWDGDGKGEVIWCPVNNFGTGNEDPDRIVVYETPGDGSDEMGIDQGDGSWAPNAGWNMDVPASTSMRPFRGTVADVDGDGDAEFVFAERHDYYVWGVVGVSDIPDAGDGSETWTMEANGTPDGGNDYRDLAVIGETIYLFSSNGTVRTITNDGTNYAVAGPHQSYPGYSWLSATNVDVDMDGTEEIVTGDYLSGGTASVFVLVEDGDSLLGYPIADFTGNTGTQITSVRAGQVDADTLVDFVVGFRGTDEVYLVSYQGGDITSAANYTVRLLDKGVNGAEGVGQMDMMTLADVDADGKDEVFYTGVPRSIAENTQPLTIGDFGDWTLEGGSTRWDMAYANNMVYVTSLGGASASAYYESDTTGWKYGSVQDGIVPGGSFKSLASYDVDGDGVEEILAGNYGSSNVYLLKMENGGLVTYEIADLSALGVTRITGGAAGDIDGDGNVDYVVGSRDSENSVVRVKYTGGDITDPVSWSSELIDSQIQPTSGQVDVVELVNLDDDPALEIVYTGTIRNGTMLPIVVLDVQTVEAETIAAVKVDANGDFVPDRMGEIVTIKGVITSPTINSVFSLSINVQDETAGINIYSSEDSIFTTVGDLVQITGEIGQYNGLTQLVVSDRADIRRLGAGTVPAPIVVAPSPLLEPADAEALESMLVRINGLINVGGDAWPDSGSDANISVWDGAKTDEGDSLIFVMRVDKDLDLAGQLEPVYPMNVVGIFTQYDRDTPPDGGYQLLPRYYADIEQDVAAPPNANFWFTEETSALNGGRLEITDATADYPFIWHPAVDLNGEDLIYQVVIWNVDNGNTALLTLSDNNGVDTSLTPTGQTLIDLVAAAGDTSLSVGMVLRTVSSNAAEGIITSVDTLRFTMADFVTDVDEQSLIPKEFFVDQNYPNPFNPSTTIQFGLPQDAKVNLVVYDILGRVVTRLIDNQVMGAGVYQRSFDASKLASGTYIYRLQADQKVEVKKMLLLK